MSPFELISRHYSPGTEAFRILVTHSVLVARKAITLARELLERRPELELDLGFIEEASLLHDIGIKMCDAPEFDCHGSEPYIRHGVEGRRLLMEAGLPRHALVCARHTGAGITADEVEELDLPLPRENYLPLSLEEKVICVADKFYSKKPPKLWRERKLEKIERSLGRHGARVSERWARLREEILG